MTISKDEADSYDMLVWRFSPPDFFEELIDISRDGVEFVIESGRAYAKIGSSRFEANPAIRDELHNELNDRFLGAQLVSRTPFKLSKPARTRHFKDGHTAAYIEPDTGAGLVMGGAADVVFTDKDGKVTFDSKRDRIEKKKSLASAIVRHRSNDAILAAILRSFDASVRDPGNELIHLYEIRDALGKVLGGKVKAIRALGVTPKEWNRLGELCSSLPLRQGRHRGSSVGQLRDATHSELEEARAIARSLVIGYLRHLGE